MVNQSPEKSVITTQSGTPVTNGQNGMLARHSHSGANAEEYLDPNMEGVIMTTDLDDGMTVLSTMPANRNCILLSINTDIQQENDLVNREKDDDNVESDNNIISQNLSSHTAMYASTNNIALLQTYNSASGSGSSSNVTSPSKSSPGSPPKETVEVKRTLSACTRREWKEKMRRKHVPAIFLTPSPEETNVPSDVEIKKKIPEEHIEMKNRQTSEEENVQIHVTQQGHGKDSMSKGKVSKEKAGTCSYMSADFHYDYLGDALQRRRLSLQTQATTESDGISNMYDADDIDNILDDSVASETVFMNISDSSTEGHSVKGKNNRMPIKNEEITAHFIEDKPIVNSQAKNVHSGVKDVPIVHRDKNRVNSAEKYTSESTDVNKQEKPRPQIRRRQYGTLIATSQLKVSSVDEAVEQDDEIDNEKSMAKKEEKHEKESTQSVNNSQKVSSDAPDANHNVNVENGDNSSKLSPNVSKTSTAPKSSSLEETSVADTSIVSQDYDQFETVSGSELLFLKLKSVRTATVVDSTDDSTSEEGGVDNGGFLNDTLDEDEMMSPSQLSATATVEDKEQRLQGEKALERDECKQKEDNQQHLWADNERISQRNGAGNDDTEWTSKDTDEEKSAIVLPPRKPRKGILKRRSGSDSMDANSSTTSQDSVNLSDISQKQAPFSSDFNTSISHEDSFDRANPSIIVSDAALLHTPPSLSTEETCTTQVQSISESPFPDLIPNHTTHPAKAGNNDTEELVFEANTDNMGREPLFTRGSNSYRPRTSSEDELERIFHGGTLEVVTETVNEDTGLDTSSSTVRSRDLNPNIPSINSQNPFHSAETNVDNESSDSDRSVVIEPYGERRRAWMDEPLDSPEHQAILNESDTDSTLQSSKSSSNFNFGNDDFNPFNIVEYKIDDISFGDARQSYGNSLYHNNGQNLENIHERTSVHSMNIPSVQYYHFDEGIERGFEEALSTDYVSYSNVHSGLGLCFESIKEETEDSLSESASSFDGLVDPSFNSVFRTQVVVSRPSSRASAHGSAVLESVSPQNVTEDTSLRSPSSGSHGKNIEDSNGQNGGFEKFKWGLGESFMTSERTSADGREDANDVTNGHRLNNAFSPANGFIPTSHDGDDVSKNDLNVWTSKTLDVPSCNSPWHGVENGFNNNLDMSFESDFSHQGEEVVLDSRKANHVNPVLSHKDPHETDLAKSSNDPNSDADPTVSQKALARASNVTPVYF